MLVAVLTAVTIATIIVLATAAPCHRRAEAMRPHHLHPEPSPARDPIWNRNCIRRLLLPRVENAAVTEGGERAVTHFSGGLFGPAGCDAVLASGTSDLRGFKPPSGLNRHMIDELSQFGSIACYWSGR
jgi:hypothetical protein